MTNGSGLEVSPAIEAVGLEKRYGRTVALQNVSLVIPTGARVALVGPNGAGKSTLLRLAIGFERPTSGRIEVLGHDTGTDGGELSGMIAYLHQTIALYRDLTVVDHLDLVSTLRRSFERDVAAQRLNDLDIPLHRRVRGLSGGQQAQVAITIALAVGGRVLLLDEPLAGLDPVARQGLLVFLRQAATPKDTLIISSHDISGLDQVCDFVVLLSRGVVVLAGAVATIIARHMALDEDDSQKGVVVGSALGPRGVVVTIATRNDQLAGGRAPSLEQILLAYLHRA